jgi:transposase
MAAENIDFILPLHFSVNIDKGLISETNKDIENPANAKRFCGDIFYVVEGKTIHLRRRINAISQATNRFGKTILISATKRRWDDVLSLYREIDEVEKKFDDLKNELEAMPLRVQKIETLQGLLFIFFVSLIMRAILLRKARDAELLDKKSIEEILMELAKLRAIKVGGKLRLTEISKKQRTILEKMKIGIPFEVNLVIKRAGI